MRKNLFVLVIAGIALVLAVPARAHDMKVMASRLVTAPGDTDTVYISYGHILPVDGQIDGDTLDEYLLRTPSGSVVYLKKEGVSLQANEVHVEEDGVYQAVASRKPAVYTEVVDGKGNHTHVRGPKSSIKEGTVDHALQSHQFSKALLVSGTRVDKPVEPLGHDLEIVPLEAPSAWRNGQDLQFQVLFKGKPLRSGDLVARPIGFKPDNAWSYATSTGTKGIATIRPSQPGTWVLRVRTQKPARAEEQARFDYDSYTATLVLEIKP